MSSDSCPYRPACPGCPRFGEGGLAPAAAAALEAVARDAGLPPPTVHEGARSGFRHRARLAVRGRPGEPKLGLFQAGSHRIAAIPRCPIHHPRINGVALALRDVIRDANLAPYADAPHEGLVRYVQITVDRGGSEAQVVVVTNGDQPAPVADLLAPLRARLGDALHSLWWNGNPERTNVILGPHWHLVHGPAHLSLDVAGARIYQPPGAFVQSHLALAERLVLHVRRQVPEGARVTEYFAGTGAIGLGLAERVERVRFNELDVHALEGLEAGIAALPGAARGRCEVLPGRAGERVDALADTDTVILDPPRKGLDAELLAALCDAPAQRILYVSCGWPSFERDCAALRSAGWRLAAIEAFGLFPYTDHAETLARFERPRSS